MSSMETVVNIASYIEGVEGKTRDMLYESPWTCQALFRSLPPLAKQYILRLLWIGDRPVAKCRFGGSSSHGGDSL